jgi:hypothetical protein
VDSIIAENPDLSLDDLLVTKKINADQKQQAERKPGLQAQLRDFEEELERYKKVEDSVTRQHESEKEALKLEHAKELDSLRDSIAQETAAAGSQQLRDKLLHLSKFLRAAAAKRQDGDENAEESRAFEGALLLVYGGDMMAVQAMENIIDGNDELVPTVDGTKTTVSCEYSEQFIERRLTESRQGGPYFFHGRGNACRWRGKQCGYLGTDGSFAYYRNTGASTHRSHKGPRGPNRDGHSDTCECHYQRRPGTCIVRTWNGR